ncbi:hypothetical protein [Rhizobium esperanzae]|uniref:Uncharacterized protein n=1 Tax=Rhizobium esperanzae TaxID=1967781 RepID=A0A7W6QZ85_9HYPH|nr:hypothetical protein [Rhizobium esperanzae]MBB4233899.1 hypothetical protein [Rhizobium esperanzae]
MSTVPVSLAALIDVVRGFTSGNAPGRPQRPTSQQDAKTSSAKSARNRDLQAGAVTMGERRALYAHDGFLCAMRAIVKTEDREAKAISCGQSVFISLRPSFRHKLSRSACV